MALHNRHPILRAAKLLSGDTIYVSSRVPKKWRVWLLDNRVIQIAAGDRVIFETGEWSGPDKSVVVVVGPGHFGVGLILANMEVAGGAH